jgi:hypothetical protein
MVTNITIGVWDQTGALLFNDTYVANVPAVSPDWVVALPAEADYTWQCNATDIGGLQSSSNIYTFRTDVTPPTVQYEDNTDSDNTTYMRGNIQVNASGDDLNWNSLTIELWRRQSNSYVLAKSVTSGNKNLFANFTGLPDNHYMVRAIAKDIAGNTVTTPWRNIILNYQPPTVSLDYPANGMALATITPNLLCTVSDGADIADLTLFLWNETGDLVTSISRTVAGTSSQQSYNIPLEDLQNYTYNCLGEDAVNLTAWAPFNATFEVDVTAPTVNFTDESSIGLINTSQVYENATAKGANGTSLASIRTYRESRYFIRDEPVFRDDGFVQTTSADSLVWNTGLPDNIYRFYAIATNDGGVQSSTPIREVIVDTTPPTMTLVSPPDNSTSRYPQVTFTCDISDAIEIDNVTFVVWDANGAEVHRETSERLSGVHNETVFVYNLPGRGTFTWNCMGTFDPDFPAIAFLPGSDEDGAILTRRDIVGIATANATSLDNIAITLSNGAPPSTVLNTTPTVSADFSDLPEGVYTMQAAALDNSGATAYTEARTIIITTNATPTLDFIPPTPTDGDSVMNMTVAVGASKLMQQCALHFDYMPDASSGDIVLEGAFTPPGTGGYYRYQGQSADAPYFKNRVTNTYLARRTYATIVGPLYSWQVRSSVESGTEYFFRDNFSVDPTLFGDYQNDVGTGQVTAYNTSDRVLKGFDMPVTSTDTNSTASLFVAQPTTNTTVTYYVSCMDLLGNIYYTGNRTLHVNWTPGGNFYIPPTDNLTQSNLSAFMQSGDIAQPFAKYHDNTTLTFKSGSTPLLTLFGIFNTSAVNLSTMYIRYDDTSTVVHFGSISGVAGTRVMYIPYVDPTHIVVVCPAAQELGDIGVDCPGATVWMSTELGSTKNGMTVSRVGGQYAIAGITGTGATSTPGNVSLRIWDETDAGMPYGNQVRIAGDDVSFFANFTNSSGLPANTTDGACQIGFDPYNTWIDMTWDAAKKLFYYNASFGTAGTYDWGVNCTSQENSINVTDTVTISQNIQPGAVPEFGTLALVAAIGLVVMGLARIRKK